VSIEPRLRDILPADLYALAWVDPSQETLQRVFDHLRTLHRMLFDYMPRHLSDNLPQPGEISYEWQEGTLIFTDLAGFTKLLEANALLGRSGARSLLQVLNAYFAEMIRIISKSGGNLLEFTGDAMLAQFPRDRRRSETAQAVRAGLRMQRAMAHFANIETEQGSVSLGMRVGVHTGRYLAANLGTPRRMEHVLLGSTVQRTKRAEGAGQIGRVNLTKAAYELVKNEYRFEPGRDDHVLVIDDLASDDLGDFDITTGKRTASPVLMDRSLEGLLTGIEEAVGLVEPLASYLPMPVLNLLVEHAADRKIPPDFPQPTVMFVMLKGLPEAVDNVQTGNEYPLVSGISRLFALINAAVEARGGVLKKVTCHLSGSDMLIYFGVPNAHTDDALRAVEAALIIREAVISFNERVSYDPPILCQIGLARGPVFSAEIGEPRGRREFNILGDTVNTAARIMSKASDNQVLVTEAVREEIEKHFETEYLGLMDLKGKKMKAPIHAVRNRLAE
jgi:class 3 adenylate cyclase